MAKELKVFANERDWDKFHSPKNLVMALSGEVGELTEVFLKVFDTREVMHKAIEALNGDKRARVGVGCC